MRSSHNHIIMWGKTFRNQKQRHKILPGVISLLDERKTSGDLIQTYKTMNGLELIDWNSDI